MGHLTRRRTIRRVARWRWLSQLRRCRRPPAKARSRPDLTGTWTLNRNASEFPQEVGFDPNWMASGPGGGVSAGRELSPGGGAWSRGRSSGKQRIGPATGTIGHFQSEEDSKKIQELVNEVKVLPAQLTIPPTDAAITVVDARGRTCARVPHERQRRHHSIGRGSGRCGQQMGVTRTCSSGIASTKSKRCVPGTHAIPALPTRAWVQCADHGQGEIIQRGMTEPPAVPVGRPHRRTRRRHLCTTKQPRTSRSSPVP